MDASHDEDIWREVWADAVERHRRLDLPMVVNLEGRMAHLPAEEVLRCYGYDPDAWSHTLPEDDPDWRERYRGWAPPMRGTSPYNP